MKISYSIIFCSFFFTSAAYAQEISWVDHSSGMSLEYEFTIGHGLSTADGIGVNCLFQQPEGHLKTFDWQGAVVNETPLPGALFLHQIGNGHIISGRFQGSMDLLGQSLEGGTGETDIYLARLDADGGLVWAVNSVSSTGHLSLVKSAVSPAGRSVLVLGPGSAHHWGTDSIASLDAGRLIIAFDENGGIAWHKHLSSTIDLTWWHSNAEVAINDAGQVWLSCLMPHHLSIGSDTLWAGALYGYDQLIAHFSPSGDLLNHQVVSGWSDGPRIRCMALQVLQDGRAIWAGYYRSGVTLGDSLLLTGNELDGLLMEIDPSMQITSISTMTSEISTLFTAMYLDQGTNELQLAGTCGREATFDGASLDVDALRTAFVLRRPLAGGVGSWIPVLYSNHGSGEISPRSIVSRNGIVHVNGRRTGQVRRMDGVLLPAGDGFLIRLDDTASVSITDRASGSTKVLSCWPSPTTGLLNVLLPHKGSIGYRVIGMDGREAFQGNAHTGSNMLQLDVGHLAPGTYAVHVRSDKGAAVSRFAVE